MSLRADDLLHAQLSLSLPPSKPCLLRSLWLLAILIVCFSVPPFADLFALSPYNVIKYLFLWS